MSADVVAWINKLAGPLFCLVAGLFVGLGPSLVVALHFASVGQCIRTFLDESIAYVEGPAAAIGGAFEYHRIARPAAAALRAIAAEVVDAAFNKFLAAAVVTHVHADVVRRRIRRGLVFVVGNVQPHVTDGLGAFDRGGGGVLRSHGARESRSG